MGQQPGRRIRRELADVDCHDSNTEQVMAIVLRCLKQGSAVEIEGLGVFRRNRTGMVDFVAETRPKVFIAYVDEDHDQASRLFDSLTAAGFDPWLDKRKLHPGQNWPRSIERAIDVSDFFVACFSQHGVTKRGHFHSELRYALDCASRLPLGEVYFIPVRLDECAVPARIVRELQYVDLFPDWAKGFTSVLSILRKAGRFRNQQAA